MFNWKKPSSGRRSIHQTSFHSGTQIRVPTQRGFWRDRCYWNYPLTVIGNWSRYHCRCNLYSVKSRRQPHPHSGWIFRLCLIYLSIIPARRNRISLYSKYPRTLNHLRWSTHLCNHWERKTRSFPGFRNRTNPRFQHCCSRGWNLRQGWGRCLPRSRGLSLVYLRSFRNLTGRGYRLGELYN